jgi:hypothetical protein
MGNQSLFGGALIVGVKNLLEKEMHDEKVVFVN